MPDPPRVCLLNRRYYGLVAILDVRTRLRAVDGTSVVTGAPIKKLGEGWFLYEIDLHHVDEKKVLFPPDGWLCPCGLAREHVHRRFSPPFLIRP